MKINLKATSFELTPAIENYIDAKLGDVGKFITDADESAMADVEIGQTTRHHKSGDLFKAEMTLHLAGAYLRGEAIADDAYAAIDKLKDEMASQIKAHQKRKNTLLKRGGRAIKSLLRGFGLKE